MSAERQRHEWMRQRRAIVAARIRIVIYGHLLFFALCLIVQALGAVNSAAFAACGWMSLLLVSGGLILAEWLHVKMRPRTPPRYVIRNNGVTEYGEEGPRAHWDWSRTQGLSIETDRRAPNYRSLVFKMSDAWLQNVQVPLPETAGQQADAAGVSLIGEREVVAAIMQALEDNGIQIQPCGGAVALVRN